MRMMIVRMEMRGRLRTAVVWDGASDMLELNGGVSDLKSIMQHAIDGFQNDVALR